MKTAEIFYKFYTSRGIIKIVNSFNAQLLITDARSRAGITQAQLAKRAGTSQPAVARYESGQSYPSTATLSRLLRACGFDIDVKLKRASIADLSSPLAQKVRKHRGEILALAKKYGATNVRIFGSVARGEDGPDSDIDFVVDYPEKFPLWKFTKLVSEVESLFDEKIDISPSRLLKSEVLKSALADAIPL